MNGTRTSPTIRPIRPCERTATTARRRSPETGTGSPSAGLRGPNAMAVASLHTLGPAGTNCELAARQWFARTGRPAWPGRHGQPAAIVLHATLEEAAEAAASTPGAALLVPVAYPDLHTLIYAHLESLRLSDTLIVDTHNMVLARRPGAGRPTSVASHPAPVELVPAGCTVRLAASNAQAALDCAAGEADACITTLPAMEANGLELVQDFGPVAMAFTVHVRR